MPISTTPLYALTPPLRPLGLWMAWREIRSASGIRSLLTPSSLPLTFLFLFQHPLPTPLLSSLFNKTFNFHCRRSLVTRTSFCLSLDCLHQRLPQRGGYPTSRSFQPTNDLQESSLGASLSLAPPSKDPAARRFSSTPAFRQGPRSGEAVEGAIRVAAPLSYAQEDTVHLPQSHFLKLPSFDRIYGKITRNVNPSPPDEHIVRWLRAQAPRLAQRDEGDKSTVPAGLYAFFCGNISLSLVVELIKARRSHDEKSVQLMRNQFRNNKVELRIPRLPHPLHAVQTQQALASGTQPPPTPAAPHIAPSYCCA